MEKVLDRIERHARLVRFHDLREDVKGGRLATDV